MEKFKMGLFDEPGATGGLGDALSGVDWGKVREPGVIPDGKYTLQVRTVGTKQTRDGTGMMVVVEVGIEQLGGMKHTLRFNVRNKSDKAVEIGLGQFKAFAAACGVYPNSLGDGMELIGKRVNCTMKSRETDFGTQSDAKNFKRASDDTPGAPAAGDAPAGNPFGG